MSSIDDGAVVDFVQSLGSPSSSGTISANTVPDKVSRRELLARINIEEATLLAEGRPWYEIKASLLQEADKAFIKDLSGMSDQYDILIPLPEDRAQLPPEGYHTFYINQLERGLRFPVPRFIQSLCDHLSVSPSQLTPNSYSSLLGLGILLKYYQAPLSLHLIYNMTQIRQKDVGKIFIRLKPEYGFIKWNPSSHKGWMSRYFFVRRNVREGIAWYCDMSWAEKPTKRVLPPPVQEYNPIPFIKDACTKCFNARDLIREDLLCHFGFSRKGVAVEGDLAERIMKSHLLEAYKKKKSEASRGSTSQAEERVDPTFEEHVDLSLEEPVNPPPVELSKEKKRKLSSGGDKHPKKKKTSSSTELNTEAGTSQPDVEVSSFIAQPVASTTVAFFQHFIPPLDVPVVSSASDKKITEALASHFLQALLWGGELSRRVTKAREVAHSSKRSLNDVMAKHDKLMKEIEEVRGASDAEKRSLEQKLTDLEASFIRLQEEMKKAGEEAEERIKRAQEEAEASWEKRKADFLKSDEFDRLCSTRALSFFQQGFDGCLTQIRDNGYSEAKNPFSFLDVLKSLEALPDNGEAGLSGEK
ncbi:hypothetical protein F511_12899 [Dorcoceras hygrometricum]|uniref:HTH cro/C1-type domain-containing protein n=1 Tax=Dorcoceras hygrometricum TaxID=472368 RepID=A0A2Z7CUK6_9LAMI|nr:hypothetical protein F511_12899 [Dorcoceras hygrometricum]